MKTRPVLRHATLDEVRAKVARFEAAPPGIGAHNYPDAFRDANGELIETEEFFEFPVSTAFSPCKVSEPAAVPTGFRTMHQRRKG